MAPRPRKAPTLKPPKPALPPTPEALHAVISKIPTKTLHAYVLARLPTAPPDTFAAFASFFAEIAPPPLLHCVRCHSDYIEVENDDRSCQVPHDESSGEIEWVSSVGRNDSEYQTEYGCCGKTVDGEGDMGPPDGWCYEGMHTTDVKRARFRDDSTSSDDMLESCAKLNCRLPGPRPRGSSSTSGVRANRARLPPLDLTDSDDDDDSIASRYMDDSDTVGVVNNVGVMWQKAKDPRRTKAVARKVTSGTLAQTRVRTEATRSASNAESSKAGNGGAPAVGNFDASWVLDDTYLAPRLLSRPYLAQFNLLHPPLMFKHLLFHRAVAFSLWLPFSDSRRWPPEVRMSYRALRPRSAPKKKKLPDRVATNDNTMTKAMTEAQHAAPDETFGGFSRKLCRNRDKEKAASAKRPLS
ncbi:hypothetical protein H4582DRAFT_2064376 [Lactarius indigo]|nr:hypothetical protein H4582DRAFT_2064376 [Lactarius indigo]